ncbi:Hint domain-containing protein [Pseudoroseomonas cervicalis]|uniref:Hint domain-containing protein n=1 Tax=Teichococcus cervicalis TaxID=204525 RepID=UPI002784705D|nr:Hint domain-containing protein [Pseudoroseomonas cervicalis]MDQ1080816.1 hypothetical protein [Pseudoroseomonas cervicalis]
MASYQTSLFYKLTVLEDGRYEIADGGFNAVTAQDETDDGVLEGSVQASGVTWEYLGQYGTGWVGYSATPVMGAQYYLFSNSVLGAGPDSAFAADPAPLPICFMPGTRIATPGGSCAVEALRIGDAVRTAEGAVRPVRWIGRQRIVPLFADRLRAWPVRIQAGALGEGLPARDLCLSPDHALWLDGLLVQAGALVNGTTIRRETALPEAFDYLHVELEDHALLLAEGVPAESFIDNVSRRRFDNYAEYVARHGEEGAAMAEMAPPRVKSARQLPRRLAEALARRATALGMAELAA